MSTVSWSLSLSLLYLVWFNLITVDGAGYYCVYSLHWLGRVLYILLCTPWFPWTHDRWWVFHNKYMYHCSNLRNICDCFLGSSFPTDCIMLQVCTVVSRAVQSVWIVQAVWVVSMSIKKSNSSRSPRSSHRPRSLRSHVVWIVHKVVQ